ncbi:lipopolysaccharide kinase InaA family protein [Endozoicomonas sp. 4G]|uniref:lipopolysaccharide kinase InaA family protein n=1 Tax=Endozoicomonas sp. 4G TaxID=2872754 RepID=UPI002079122A|nr:lipopolysaccharide kinase InaA family protein [Endozoicomonas sp. 4G]
MLKSSFWTISKQYQNSPAANVFSTIDKVFDLKGETITDDELSDVIKVNVAGTNYNVKRYTSGGKGLRRYMGRSRIRAEWENMLLFHSFQIPAAKVVAYGEEKVLWHDEARGTDY